MSDEEIFDIVTRAESGEYDIPEIQRQFVWRPEQVATLCDSLFQGFPMGSLLLWDARDYAETQVGELGTRRPYWIVDGQQRVSSLCLLFGRQPRWWAPAEWSDTYQKYQVFLNFPVDPSGKPTFGRRARSEHGWISIPVERVIGADDSLGAMAVAREWGRKSGRPQSSDKLVDAAVKLWNVRNQKIPVIGVGHDFTPEDVAEVFRRLNEKGTRVRQTDVRLAYIAAHNPGWVRGHFYPFLEQLEDDDWSLDPGHILQAITTLKTGKARVREVERSFWREQVTAAWPEVRGAIEEVLVHLWDLGVLELDVVPSDYTLIPVITLHAKFGGSADYSFDEVFRWFILANLSGRYSGAPLQVLSNDASAIFESDSLNSALKRMEPDFSADDLRESLSSPFKRGTSQALLLHCVLFRNEARDWLEGHSIAALTGGAKKLEPHWHHILPRAWARRNNYDDVEQVANVTLICAKTNVKDIGSRPPWEYAKDRIPLDAMRSHLIPDKYASRFCSGVRISNQEFSEFLADRRDLLASSARKHFRLG